MPASPHWPGPVPRLVLRPNPDVAPRTQRLISSVAARLPFLEGAFISVTLQPDLTAHRGQLLSGQTCGIAVHAATFIRQRRIVLETALLRKPLLLRLILQHEVFHFVWVRLNKTLRSEFAALLETECQSHARGELGESAAVHKCGPTETLWRNYVCESFCDTAACLYAGAPPNLEYRLAHRWRKKRHNWIESLFSQPRRC